jgi:hypothetical protein
MSTGFATRCLRLVAICGLSIAMFVSPIGVAADTIGGGGTDLGLDAITITGASVAGRTGAVTVTGSVACSQDINGYVDVYLSQVVGRLNTISGEGYTEFQCLAANGTAPFSLSVSPYSGKFAGGSATIQGYAYTYTCTDVECFDDFVSVAPTTIRLSH